MFDCGGKERPINQFLNWVFPLNCDAGNPEYVAAKNRCVVNGHKVKELRDCENCIRSHSW